MTVEQIVAIIVGGIVLLLPALGAFIVAIRTQVVAKETHRLVNADFGRVLAENADLRARLADRSGDPGDRALADRATSKALAHGDAAEPDADGVWPADSRPPLKVG